MNAIDASRVARLWCFVGVLALGGVLVAVLGPYAAGHRSQLIIETELAGNGLQILDRRSPHVQGDFYTVEALRNALLFDVGFIVGYTVLFMVGLWLAVPLFRVRLLRTKALSVGIGAAGAAGACDLLENLMLWLAASIKDERGPDWLFVLAATFATAKFVLLIGLVVLACAGFVSGLCTPAWLFERLHEDSRNARPQPDAEPPREGHGEPEFDNARGIALSGGGVRAASLSLGVLQGLEGVLATGPSGSGSAPMGPPEPSDTDSMDADSMDAAQEGAAVERPADPPHLLGWNDVRRVTAVSGGSYMAGAWQLARNPQAGDTAEAWAMRPDGKPGPEETHLLKNLGYLASTFPRGREDEPAWTGLSADDVMGDRLRNRASVWATIAVGFAVNLVVLMATLVIVLVPVALALDWLVSLDSPCRLTEDVGCAARQPRLYFPPVFWAAFGALASVLWLLASKRRKTSTRLLRLLKAATRGGLVLSGLFAVLLLGYPTLIAFVAHGEWWTGGVSLTALAGTVGAIVRIARTRVPELAPMLGGIAFGVLLLTASAWFSVQVVRMEAHWRREPWGFLQPVLGDEFSVAIALTIAVALAILVGAQLAGPELWSLFAFYRGKLRLAYGLHRTRTTDEAVPYVNEMDKLDLDDPENDERRFVQEPSLTDLKRDVLPSLTICAASHATTRGVKTHYRIPAMSFTFGADFVQTFEPHGDDGTYRRFEIPTQRFEAAYRGSGGATSARITTMAAVALAGAAVAPVMGRFRAGPTSMLITFGNVRLGAWLPNPRYLWQPPAEAKAGGQTPRFPHVGLSYLYKEFLGVHDPAEAYVYVSDGGHWENTGLVEMLRPRIEPGTDDRAEPPREIVCVDADPGRASSVHQLAQALDLAKLECDVDVFMDLEPLRGFAREDDGPVFAERSVNLGLMRRGKRWGILWHCKPVLSLASPAPLLAHREIDAKFPHTSTVDQFFDTATYVAYRDLGRHNAAEIKTARDRLGRFLHAKSVQDVMAATDEDRDAFMWVSGAFQHLLHQIPQSQREVLLADVVSALGDQVRAPQP